MRNRKLRHKQYAHLLSFVGLALVLTSTISMRGSGAFVTRPVEAAAQSSPTPPLTGGKYNGKLVIGSGRQQDGGTKLWSVNADGSSPTQLTFESERDPNLPSYAHVYDDRARWSPDGAKIAFQSLRSAIPPDGPDPDSYTIYMIDSQGHQLQPLVLDKLFTSSSKNCTEMDGFEWSPDGSKFAVMYGQLTFGEDFCQGTLDTDIYTVNTDGSGLVRLTNGVHVWNYDPTWSPDGKQIAFVSRAMTGEEATSIDVMNADGSSRRQVANFGHGRIEWTRWSPDGAKILFARFVAGWGNSIYRQFFTMNPDGSDLKQLTFYPANHKFPSWAPDGKKIVYTRGGLFVMNADGSNEQPIGDLGGEPDWQPLTSPANEPPPSVVGFDSGIYLATGPNPSVQITVIRTGNLDQAVSCDYQIRHSILSGLPKGTLSFLPGETSKTIQFSLPSYDTYSISLSNNAGNATFVGGIKDATIIFASPGINPIDNLAFFVRQQYRDFLNREPDAPGWDFWTINITKCSGPVKQIVDQCIDRQRGSTSAAFFLSPEFQNTGSFVLRLYWGSLGKLPAAQCALPAGLSGQCRPLYSDYLADVSQVARGIVVNNKLAPEVINANKRAFVDQFVNKAEFKALYDALNNQQFVDKLFTITGIVPSDSERSALVNGLDSGTETRSSVVFKVVDGTQTMTDGALVFQTTYGKAFFDQEFDAAFVFMEYVGYLRRNPDQAGYDFWLAKLKRYGNWMDAEMVRAFILSPEYRQRFSQP